MSKHNYSQYSNKKKSNYSEPKVEVEETITTTAATEVEPVEIKMEYETPVERVYVNETVETPKPKTKVVTGTVTGCNRLNVRLESADGAEIVAIINRDSKVKIDPVESTDDWFKVTTTDGVEGYCMCKFVSVKR